MEKILIIDDDPDIVESTKVVLESRGYKVISAPSGKEGLKMTRKENPDLIILDVMMEKADTGFELCRELKKEQSYKNIPILMLTAIKEKTRMDFKNETGDEIWLPVDDYCDKPLKPDELLSKVGTLLKKR
jgi:DNA-binding response OmpR family regulator